MNLEFESSSYEGDLPESGNRIYDLDHSSF
jgi:hypothetical protein